MNPFSLLNNNHSKAKKYYSYDRYVDDKLDFEVTNDCIAVAEFIAENPSVVAAPANSKRSWFNYPIVGHLVSKSTVYPVSPDATKKFIKSLIVGVQDMLDEKECLCSFDESNIVVTKGKGLFKHLESTSLSSQAKRSMYESLYSFIKGLFGNGPTPEDIQHLLGLIKGQKKEILYKIHPSLVLHKNRGCKLERLREVVKFELSDVSKRNILSQLPYVDSWRSTRWLNDVLLETYDYSPSSYEPYRPGDKTEEEWTPFEQRVQSAEQFLDFIRNGICHRMERLIKVSADEHETILLVHFPMLLPKLQELIFDEIGAERFKSLGLS